MQKRVLEIGESLMANVIDGQTNAAAYVANVPGNGGYQVTPLLTVGDEFPLLTGEGLDDLSVVEGKTFAFTGVPDGIGLFTTEEAYYVFVNHELSPSATSDISSTVPGQIKGAQVSLLKFDKDWNVIGGKSLIEQAVDSTGTYVLDTTTGTYVNAATGASFSFNRFCSGYLAEYGFEDGPIYFAPEEFTPNGRAWAVSTDGTAQAIDGLGRYAKENILAASQYRAENSEKTVLISTEDFADGEVYMFVGEQTAEDPNGFKRGDLYVLKVEGHSNETLSEGVRTGATWTQVDSNVVLNPDGKVLSDWVNTESRSTNFRRPEDIHEDPNNAGTFYFVTTGAEQRLDGSATENANEAENPYGKLYRFSLNADDPTGAINDFELLLSGGPGKGVSYDNIVVDSNGNVLIQEDAAAFGDDVMAAEGRDAQIWSFNPESGEIVPLFEAIEGAAGPKFNDPEPGNWETSGIIEVPTDSQGRSAYLFDVQAHSIRDPQYLGGNYVQGGQLLLAVPVANDPTIGGDNGRDQLSGSRRSDTIWGDKSLYGPGGNDRINANSGNDLVFAGGGNDSVKGGRGDDIIYGGAGDDSIDGNSGNDKIYGNDGNDYLKGSEGNDEIFGEAGNDNIEGGSGNDKLYAQDGDTLTGGAGSDQFWIVDSEVPTAGSRITDFQAGKDILGLGAGLAYANLKINQLGDDTLISLKDGNKALAILEGVDAGSLSITNFVSTAARPLVIGHRGASGLRPEHTLAAYELAIEQGADFIEPDVVSTKDGILIARHENEISGTTDVADRPEFASRRATKIIDGSEVTGWFTEDFTLAEIKTLRANERLPFRDQSFNGQFEVPTLQEVIDLAKSKSAELGRTVGIYPETKHPTYFDSIGLSLEEPLVAVLDANGYTSADSPVFIQSFEVSNLQQLNELTKVPLVQLFDAADVQPYDFVATGDTRTYGDLLAPTGLAEIATYADGIGPWKRLIIPAESVDFDGNGQPDDLNGDGQISDADRLLQAPTTLIEDAHAAGLLVHAYTFRNEDFYLAPDYNGDPALEYQQFFSLGLDGLFSDFPGTAAQVANQLYPFTQADPLNGVGLLAPSPETSV
ncbi:glycerophosphodiester phosphodiesterase family protein [Leptolyngbya sp. FACHB-261]|uniref:glycerophosphodiester phosphodiesterase family protein n=1 Tax=Leptolyngbya sp. FACHB-261 TaxID=2692806 RepID=UPI00168483AD|nr:glycerophosphodiester phosphodiesterase family protein [Leptolyngbya sp. FACHB-261]MBD2101216.1 DUF839 domain-containing protein [Leptolyngbya sp. FACHB-261]